MSSAARVTHQYTALLQPDRLRQNLPTRFLALAPADSRPRHRRSRYAAGRVQPLPTHFHDDAVPVRLPVADGCLE